MSTHGTPRPNINIGRDISFGYALVFVALSCLAAAAYMAKRSLGIDVVPGVDMLPDPEIEAMIQFVMALFVK